MFEKEGRRERRPPVVLLVLGIGVVSPHLVTLDDLSLRNPESITLRDLDQGYLQTIAGRADSQSRGALLELAGLFLEDDHHLRALEAEGSGTVRDGDPLAGGECAIARYVLRGAAQEVSP